MPAQPNLQRATQLIGCPAAIAGIEVMLKGKDIATRSDSVLGWLLANWDKTHLRLCGNKGAIL
jgi:hypothetical protein